MLNILVADDHPLFRRGVRDILTEGLGPTLVGEAGTVPELLQQVQTQSWDLVIMDLSMPGRPGSGVVQELRQHQPRLPVLVVSMHPEDQYAVRMFRSGANGYLTKAGAPTELLAAVRKILSGGNYVSEAVADQLALEVKVGTDKPAHEMLSDREFQVLCLIANGKTVSEIGDDLSLGVTTISTYRTRILEKLQLKNNAELMRYALEHRLVE